MVISNTKTHEEFFQFLYNAGLNVLTALAGFNCITKTINTACHQRLLRGENSTNHFHLSQTIYWNVIQTFHFRNHCARDLHTCDDEEELNINKLDLIMMNFNFFRVQPIIENFVHGKKRRKELSKSTQIAFAVEQQVKWF